MALVVVGGGGYTIIAEQADAGPVKTEPRKPLPIRASQPKLYEEPLDPNWPAADSAADQGPFDNSSVQKPPFLPAPEQQAGAARALDMTRTIKENFDLKKLPWSQRYVGNKVITSFPNLTSPGGPCMDKRTNPPRPHPVGAAHCGQLMWNNYRLTKDRYWLGMAKNQARWLINFRQVYSGAWFYPYLWDSTLHASAYKPAIILRKPWYSAMAQGEALSLFVRLYESTGEAQYKTAADRTFDSLLIRNVAGKPWATWTHYNYLWFEETTFTNGTGDRIFNGHMFTLFGVYDYWMITADRRARELAKAALSTSLAYASRLRRPNWRSYYDDYRRGESNGYHYTHTSQLRFLAEMTGDKRFNKAALAMWQDHPMDVTTGAMYLAKGQVQGYSLVSGRMSLVKTVTLDKASLTVMSWKNRIAGYNDMWMKAGAGPLRGLYIKQQPAKAYVNTPTDGFNLRIPMVVTTRANSVTYLDTETGEKTTETPGGGTRIDVLRYSVIGGLPYFQVSSGEQEGRWVAMSQLTV